MDDELCRRVLSEQFASKFWKEALQHPTIDLPYRGKTFTSQGIILTSLKHAVNFRGLKEEKSFFIKMNSFMNLSYMGAPFLIND